ncbi:3-dehydroquinate synthase [Paenibacillus chitinolyticus]|uniref:2-deoxy-scyllo-inosose synthase n=1 Tax=Paenibacillus chitinolyticus TaxID=79263 RepID=UPI0026E4CF4F|nr:2-deoxy-scyllo-inosose synthase [Paenibacillus chitinolyticus]GKS12686.1 3-dehydroquinate synthase [Paenibacillus chitinolyticus]
MTTKQICFADRCFNFAFGEHILESIEDYIPRDEFDRYIVISDSGVPDSIVYHAAEYFGKLAPVHILRFQGGEEYKTLSTVTDLQEQAIALGANRRTAIVAVGGGLTGNVAGVAAGMMFRGIALIHVPTTFLAASDSVLSIKQAVNLTSGKNLVGFYYPPRFVFADTRILSESPPRQVKAGMCELVKNMLILENDNLEFTEDDLNSTNVYSPKQLETFINFCISAKMSVLSEDIYEKKKGLIFEYGHTIGHAIELAEQGGITHGEAIAVGMIYAAKIANRMNLLSEHDVSAHYWLLNKIGALQDIPLKSDPDSIFHYLNHDNKRGYLKLDEDNLGMILLSGVGKPAVYNQSLLTPVRKTLIKEVIREGL